jgi:hypothetical protein
VSLLTHLNVILFIAVFAIYKFQKLEEAYIWTRLFQQLMRQPDNNER